jgi:hypothetical protein
MKIMCIYSPLISPPVTPGTSNKLNQVDSMGREWFQTARLQWRVAKGVMMLRETSKLENRRRRAFHYQQLTFPRHRTHISNKPNAENLVGGGWYYWTIHKCGRVAAGEVDVFNIIFCTQNTLVCKLRSDSRIIPLQTVNYGQFSRNALLPLLTFRKIA